MTAQELHTQATGLWHNAKGLNVAAGASLDPKKTIEGMQSAIGKKFDLYFDALVLFRQAEAEDTTDITITKDKVQSIIDALTEVAPAELLIEGWELIPFGGCHTFVKGKLKAYYEREHDLFVNKYHCADYATYITRAFAEVYKVVDELIADADKVIAALPDVATTFAGYKKTLVAKRAKVAKWEKHMA
jgi:hypothetical protein